MNTNTYQYQDILSVMGFHCQCYANTGINEENNSESERERDGSVMIHEQQVRQLCAIHAVNNLLQLPSNLDYDLLSEEGQVPVLDSGDHEHAYVDIGDSEQRRFKALIISHEWACNENILFRYYEHCGKYESVLNSHPTTATTMHYEYEGGDARMQRPKRHWRVATQQEFDDIAYELTLREKMLTSSEDDESTFISGDACSSRTSRNKQISLLQRICSQHGTPYFGNYSIEVMKEALIRRGVELEFYRLPSENNVNDDAEGNITFSSTSKCLIGFILHIQDQRAYIPSPLLRIGRSIPIVKNFCDIGRHWYAITRVQYKQHTMSGSTIQSCDIPSQQFLGEDTTTTASSWCLIDSKVCDISTFHTKKELHDFMRHTGEREGCLVFAAYFIRNES